MCVHVDGSMCTCIFSFPSVWLDSLNLLRGEVQGALHQELLGPAVILKLAQWAGTFSSRIPLPEELVFLQEGGNLELSPGSPTPYATLVWGSAGSISNSPGD